MKLVLVFVLSLAHLCSCRRWKTTRVERQAEVDDSEVFRPSNPSSLLGQFLFSLRSARVASGGRASSRRIHPRAEVAVLKPDQAHVATWKELASHLPEENQKEDAALTLYRDTNGWCPFCERILLTLNRKGIPYDEVLIDLKNKPQWYKDMIPTELVPAMKIHDSDEIVYESLDIMTYLDEHFPETEALLQPQADVAAALERNDAVMTAAFRFAYGIRNVSLSDSEKDDRRKKFIQALREMDDSLNAGGPFLVGSSMSAADICLIPMMERYRYQLPLQADVKIYDDQWPGIKRWFDAMDADPAYSESVAGDETSWTLVTSTFLRLFARNADGGIDEATQQIIANADAAAENLLEQAAKSSLTAKLPSHGAAVSAARKLIANHEAVLADACAGGREPLSQNTLQRLPPSASNVVDHVLRNAAARLLGLEPTIVSGKEAAQAAQAARFVATRICAPRDMGAAAAAALRQVLFLEEASAKAMK